MHIGNFPLFTSCICSLLIANAACFAQTDGVSPTPQRQVLQLNQGWSDHDVEFYHHAVEGTNLAPLDFFLNLPDPASPGSRFVDKLSKDFGFIPSEKSRLNPHGLPAGIAVDDRPTGFGDRVYVGLTCSACHTRQLTYSGAEANGTKTSWVLPVHGGPSLVDMPRFKNELYDAFFALLDNDEMFREFAQGVLSRAPDTDDTVALRNEIREFMGPVTLTRAIIAESKVPFAAFGPGNLNALSQGNYNNLGLSGWLVRKGHLQPGNRVPSLPRFEGTDNYPPMWFAPGDDWAQWFVEIHHPGPRNWVQSVSTSEVRPPKMIEALKAGVLLGSIHFENIADIQRSLELLRTPKWPESVLGTLDRALVEEGRVLYETDCAVCHTRKVLPPNELGIVFKDRPAYDVGTDPIAYQQFAVDAEKRRGDLEKLSKQILALRESQLEAKFGPEIADNFMKLYSRGRPNLFALTTGEYADPKGATWEKSGAACWASPMEGIFASSPYFHNGSVRTLWDVLAPPEKRQESFRTGSTEFDVSGVGLRDEGPFLYDTKQTGKGNGGHLFGTDLPQEKKAALIEYLKSL